MKLLFVSLFIIGGFSAYNQSVIITKSNDRDNEKIFVQTNSTFLITGETLYFKIFCQHGKNNKPTVLSKVAYVEIIDETGAPALQTKVSLENGNGHGDVFIPSALSSGNYSLIAYTRWMRNFSSDSFYKSRLTIINPFKKPAVSRSIDKKTLAKRASTTTHSNGIQLKLSGTKFKTREKVNLAINTTDISTLTVSVRKKETALDDAGTILGLPYEVRDSVLVDNSISASPFSSRKSIESPSPAKTYLPEMRGHLITGAITPKNSGSSAAKKIILASIPGSTFEFKASATDQQGKFAMTVDHIAEASTIVFQMQDEDINNYTLTLDDQFLPDHSKFKSLPLTIANDLQALVDERNIFTQVENAYYAAKKDSITFAPYRSFYNIPDKVYKLDDFTRFPTMEDIFREYVPEVVVKHRGDEYILQVVSPRFGASPPKEPLMLIDGVAILNTNTLMAYDPLKVERIEIIKEKYFYGSLDIDGIISLRTYKGAIDDLPSITSQRENLIKIQSDKVYFFPDYTSDKKKLERVPDYRLQLYWNPDVITTKDKTAAIDFYTSDVTGDFEITVEGFSSAGALIHSNEIISVSK